MNTTPDTGKPDILCFSSTDWDGVWGSRQQVMVRFAARGYRVVFVEQPAGLEHLARYPDLRARKLRRWREGLRRVTHNLWVYSLPPLLPGRYYSRALNDVNQALTTRYINRVLRELDSKPGILWLYQPELAPMLHRFGERLSVYHCIDEHTANARGRKRRVIGEMEEALLGGVDVVFANSLATYHNKQPYNSNTHRIPSGADLEHFGRALAPGFAAHPQIETIPEPRIGYMGYVNERLDYDTLEFLAARHPEWSLVFVGGTYPWTRDAPPLRRLREYTNVHFLGDHAFADMPAFVRGMSVCLLPYVADERANYRSPLKLYEYLAAGKAVVATRHPEIPLIDGVVYVGDTPEEIASLVSAAIQDDAPERRRQRVDAARPHSWDDRVDDMERIILESMKKR